MPGGAYGFNNALEPQTSNNYEVGARGLVLDERLDFEIALFRQDVHNLISPVGLLPNNSFQNVGQGREYRVESGAHLRISRGVAASVTYTYSNFVFEDFASGSKLYTGNRLPGVPDHMWAGELRYHHSSTTATTSS